MSSMQQTNGSANGGGDENVVGNLNRYAATPSGHEGPILPGMLVFDASFEAGNLGRVDVVNEYEYDLFIRPDTYNSRYRVFFHFAVWNTKQDQRVLFNIVNSSKTKSLFREGMTPIVKSTSRPKWTRLPTKSVFWYRSPDHKKNYVLSFAFCFDNPDDTFQFGYIYPYTYTRLQRYLELIDNRKQSFWHRELLTYSVQQRRLDLLTITNRNLKDTNMTHRVIFVTARVHPGETPASYVCQGFLDFIVSSHPIAVILRDNFVFKVVPMLNPDGVQLGNYRCSLMGFDLNRHWLEPSKFAHPTIYHTKQLLLAIANDPKYDLDIYVDLHAHSTCLGSFMYGNHFEESDKTEKQVILPRLLAATAEDFSLGSTNFNRDAVKAGTGRRTLGGCLDESICYTLEVSFWGYVAPSTNQFVPYTEDLYARLGRSLARGLLQFYRFIGYLPTPVEQPLAAASKNNSTTASFSTNGTNDVRGNRRTVARK